MALTHIIQKILTDAEAEAKKIQERAQQRAQEIADHADQRIESIQVQYEQETQQRTASMERKISAHIQMEKKMGEANLKSELLDAAKKEALGHIAKLSEKEKVDILVHLLHQISEKGTVHPAKGQTALIEKAMSQSGKKFAIRAEENSVTAGFLFQGEKTDIQASFEVILEKEIFPAIEEEVSKTLFSE